MNKEFINDGVILGDHLNTYKSGRLGAVLPFEERNPSGDWESVLPPEERQSNDGGDSMSCVTFAILNGIETQEKYQTGFFQEYSDRWIAKMSGTTREGNYLWKVAENIRKIGLVKEESYPKPPAPWTWGEYHKFIPADLQAKLEAEGQEWLKKWDVKYESVAFDKESLMKHLKMAPLTVVIPGHAILNFRTTAQIIHYFDQYNPFKKTVSSVIQAMKVVLYKKEQAVPDEVLLVDIKYGDSGRQVIKLLAALRKLGWFYKDGLESQLAWDIYNDRVAELVKGFKMTNTCPNFWGRMLERYLYKGREVNARERDIINKLTISK